MFFTYFQDFADPDIFQRIPDFHIPPPPCIFSTLSGTPEAIPRRSLESPGCHQKNLVPHCDQFLGKAIDNQFRAAVFFGRNRFFKWRDLDYFHIFRVLNNF